IPPRHTHTSWAQSIGTWSISFGSFCGLSFTWDDAMTKTLVPVLASGVALLLLWATSWGLSYAHLGMGSLPIALFIAVFKAALVAIVFMELRFAQASVVFAFVAGLCLLALLGFFSAADILTR